jgi:hypothetical protein
LGKNGIFEEFFQSRNSLPSRKMHKNFHMYCSICLTVCAHKRANRGEIVEAHGASPEGEISMTQPENVNQRKKRQNHVHQLIDALATARSADHLRGMMGMSSTELRRVIGSRTFRNWFSMQQQLTKVLLASDAMGNLYGTLAEIFKLRESPSEGAAIKACMVLLNNALLDPFGRDGARSNPSNPETLINELLHQKPLLPLPRGSDDRQNQQ